MPPKKEEVEDKKVLGRFGTSLKIGIVGMPNVGKSTFFNVLTSSHIPAENYPFCTKEPHDARVAVPDERFDWLCDFHKPPSKVPAYLNVVDIAGLVKGAHEGEGLGNAFLSNISACDAMFSMSRAFEDEDIIHVEGDVDPIRDLEIIANELRLKDLEKLKELKDKAEKVARRVSEKIDKSAKIELDIVTRVHDLVESGKDVRSGDWSLADIEYLNDLLLLTAKPVIYLVNLSEKDYARKKNKWLAKIAAWVKEKEKNPVVIPLSATFELQYIDKSGAERDAYCASFGETATTSILPKIIKTGFSALSLEYYFTAGEDEVRAWVINKYSKAPQAAGKIHTDFEKGFIMADVMNFADFKECGSEAATRAAGKLRQQGKLYTVMDGDIIEFKFNAGAGLKGGKK